MRNKSTINQAPASPSGRPRAVAAGVIFGGVDCYVLADGSTVLTNRGMYRGLRGQDCGTETGNLTRYLERLPEKYSPLAAGPILEFETPDGHLAHGRPASDFVSMCRAYAEMLQEGTIHKARIPLARNAIGILSYLADRGINEIIYEACGWQRAVVQAPAALDATVLVAALDKVLAPVMAAIAAQNDRLAIIEERQRDGQILAPERGNAIKARVSSCAADLAKLGIEKRRAASLRIHKRLKMRVGWYGDHCRLDNMPARHEADVLRELEIIEHETRGKVEGARQMRLPHLTVIPGNANAGKKTG